MPKIPLIDGLPKDFVERIKIQYPLESKQILKSFKQRSPVIRINTLISSLEEVHSELIKHKINFEIIDDLSNAFFLDKTDRRKVTDLDIYKEGKIYIQSKSSQFAVMALNPKENEDILDLCAAPGSKTTQIAILMQKKGRLIANDNNRKRIYRLKANLIHQKCEDFVDIKNYSGQNYPKFYKETFDKVLVDAPCSSEARFDKRYPKSINFWSRHKVKSMAKLQKRLLQAAIECIRPGGTVVYSTCTMSPEENEAVLTKVLNKYEDISLEKLEWRVDRLNPLNKWKEKSFHDETKKAIRFFPDETTEAFFIAKIIKNPIKS